MLDKTIYTPNGDGSFTVTTTHTRQLISVDIPNEVAALQVQLTNFQIGRNSNPSTQSDIDATIASVQQALQVLPVIKPI